MKPSSKANTNDRALALSALTEVLDKKVPFSYLELPLTPFAKHLCFGVLREYIRLDAIAEHLIDNPIKKLSIKLVLLLGLYQLRCVDEPHYASIFETVSLLNTKKNSWAKGLVNAVLRRYLREEQVILNALASNEAYRFNTPTWLLKRLKKAWPAHWEQIVAQSNEHPPMSLRVNQQKTTVSHYIEQLDKYNMPAHPISYTKHALVLDTPVAVTELPGFSKEGLISVQDAAAGLAAELLDLKAKQHVLDACAAPGGKTCHMLETEPSIICTAVDVEAKRVQKTQENLKRLGLEHLNITLKIADAAIPSVWWDGTLFDRILLDAPCSATGVIRRHPDIKLLRTTSEIKAIQVIQKQLLNALWPLLAPGGILLYATCSIFPEENNEQIKEFVAQHQDCEVIGINSAFGHVTSHGLQIFPGENTMDGFFYSKLLKAKA